MTVKKAPKAMASSRKSGTILTLAAKALDKPGVARKSVFGDGKRVHVYAYSINPCNPKQIVREDAAGKKVVGTVVHGKFRPTARK